MTATRRLRRAAASTASNTRTATAIATHAQIGNPAAVCWAAFAAVVAAPDAVPPAAFPPAVCAEAVAADEATKARTATSVRGMDVPFPYHALA